MNYFLSPFATTEDLVSRDAFSSPVPRQPAHLHTQFRLDLVLTYGIAPDFRGGVHLLSVCGLDVNQCLSQPTKYIPLTAHKAPELTKLQAASYVGVM